MMQKNISVMVSNTFDDVEHAIHAIYEGIYQDIPGGHMVTYEEYPDINDPSQPVQPSLNTLHIDTVSATVTLTREGISSTKMYFQKGHEYSGTYGTLYGDMQMSLSTNYLSIEESKEHIDIYIQYIMSLNGTEMEPSNIHIQLTGQKGIF